MTAFETVLTGIASSLVATFIFLSLSWVFKNIVLPWYADKIYRGVRVDGRWTRDLGGASDLDSSIEINQKGDVVTGIYSHEVKHKTDITTYRFFGEIKNIYLNASIWPIAKDHLDTGAFVLRIYSSDGLRMKGVLTYISTEDGAVVSDDVVFVKSDS